MLILSPELIDKIQKNANVFMRLSNITLTGAERLTNLNLDAARTALDDGAVVSSLMFDSNRSATAQTAAPGKAAENTLAYFQSVQQIAAETHQEVTTLMTAFLASQAYGMSQASNWIEGLEALAAFGIPLNEGGRRLMADIRSNESGVMATSSRKRATT